MGLFFFPPLADKFHPSVRFNGMHLFPGEKEARNRGQEQEDGGTVRKTEREMEGAMACPLNTNRVFPSRGFALMAPGEARKQLRLMH